MRHVVGSLALGDYDYFFFTDNDNNTEKRNSTNHVISYYYVVSDDIYLAWQSFWVLGFGAWGLKVYVLVFRL